MSIERPDIGEAVDLLANILPSRALRTVCNDEQLASLSDVISHGINDRNLIGLLQDRGVQELQITRAAVEKILEGKYAAENESVFTIVNDDLKGAQNPFVPHVRSLIEEKCQDLFRQSDDADPA